ncbi:hypothetical protein GM160_03310 [Guyparkeria halophila]|uniref:DUF7424 domain-containing protein n=1 Tax=Guyparkeria halophila TaxID=47960 RepID=A0A6I6CXB7_9GAMM|nr:hypothetical protein [Guyparkeria halophila]QGT78000.1 hypothetical protein GM160_03310 [Guyparkeria halophila]
MKKTRSLKLAALAATIGLAGCDIDVTSQIYAEDAFAEENLPFPAEMRIEIPSCGSDQRPQFERDVIAAFSQPSEAKVVGCEEEGMDSMLRISFMGEMATKVSRADVVIFRGRSEQTGNVLLTADLNDNFQNRIEGIFDKNSQRLEFDDISMRFVLNNDTRSNISFFVNEGWVDGQPVQAAQGTLKPRRSADIRSTAVVSDGMLRNGFPFVMQIGRSADE